MVEDFDWVNPYKLELKVADISSRQAKHGTNFKLRNALWHIHSLSDKIINLDKVMVPLLPKMMNKGNTYKKPFKINGQFQKWPGLYAESVGLKREEVGGPFTPVWYTPFDPSKSDRVKNLMLDLGWKPTEWNEKKMDLDVWSYRRRLEKNTFPVFMKSLPREEREKYELMLAGYVEKHFKNKSRNYMMTMLSAIGFRKGQKPTFGEIKKKLLLKQYWPSSPKITEDSFDSIREEDGLVMKLLKQRMVWSHRRSLLQGLVDQVRSDCKLEGQLNPCATPTARGRHRIIVNIPAAYAEFGPQCRGLFVGDSNPTAKPTVICKAVKEGMRVKPHTNILEEWDDKKNKWVSAGKHKILVPAGQDHFVGADGAGLELRMLTHYLIYVPKLLLKEAQENYENGEISESIYNGLKRKFEAALKSAYEYREQLLHDDIHKHNQRLAGLPTRGAAKTFSL